MMRRTLGVVLAMALGAVTGCGKPTASASLAGDSLVFSQRLARLDSSLAKPDRVAAGKPIALWKLPDGLKETSGLALTADGRLLTHGDEQGKVFQIDYRRGVIVKEFDVGSPAVRGDFESIALAGDTVLLFTSDGILYRFPEGADKTVVPYTRLDTELGSECEFESMVVDASSGSLLLACKKVHD